MTQTVAIVHGAGAVSAPRRRAGWPRTDCVGVLDLDEAGCAGTVKEIADAGGRAVAVGADVSQRDQVEAAVERGGR